MLLDLYFHHQGVKSGYWRAFFYQLQAEALEAETKPLASVDVLVPTVEPKPKSESKPKPVKKPDTALPPVPKKENVFRSNQASVVPIQRPDQSILLSLEIQQICSQILMFPLDVYVLQCKFASNDNDLRLRLLLLEAA